MNLNITSTANPKIKSLVKLKKRSERDSTETFLIEGFRPIERALESGFKFEELYYCPELFLGQNEMKLVEQAKSSGARVVSVAKLPFMKLTYRDRPEGLLGVGRQWHTNLDDLKLSKNPFLIVVESIEKPGNLGTILRSADATGADAVVICDSVTDLFNPNVVRASTGVMFRIPIVVTTTGSLLKFCKSHSIETVAATPHTDILHTDVDFTKPTALLVGSEQFGLQDSTIKACDTKAKLPMLGQADSLNVSAATVVLAYEVVRQRHEN